MRIILSFFIVLLLPIIALSQGVEPYFEFAAKLSDPLNIVDQPGDVFEVFLTQNDHLSGVDIWVDNPGIGGQVSFGVREYGSNDLLTASTINVLANVAPTFAGKRIHIDFSEQIATDSDKKYSLKILSEIPEFRVYQANRRLVLLQHNAPYTSEYINGVAEVGGLEQDFTFKFALYENQETIPPVLSNATTTVISLNEVRLNFNANEPVDFNLQYSIQGGGFFDEIPFSGDYTLCSQGASPCVALLSVLPDSIYSYVLTAKDEWGNETEITGSFESADSGNSVPSGGDPGEVSPPPTESADTTPPVITNLRVVSVTQKSVKVAWTTNEGANSTLRITGDAEGNEGAVAFITDPVFELEHTLTSPSALSASTTYYAHISSTDLSGNNSGNSLVFMTSPGDPGDSNENPPPPSADEGEDNPSINPDGGGSGSGTEESGFASPPVVEFSSGGEEAEKGVFSGSGAVTFKWSIPLEGAPEDGYRLDVFDESGNLVKQIYVGPDEGTEVKIKGLTPGKYTIIIYSNRGGVFERIAEPTQIVILSKTLFERIIQFWYIYIAVVAIIVMVPWYFIRKESARLKNI